MILPRQFQFGIDRGIQNRRSHILWLRKGRLFELRQLFRDRSGSIFRCLGCLRFYYDIQIGWNLNFPKKEIFRSSRSSFQRFGSRRFLPFRSLDSILQLLAPNWKVELSIPSALLRFWDRYRNHDPPGLGPRIPIAGNSSRSSSPDRLYGRGTARTGR